MLFALLSTDAHPVGIRRRSNPDGIENPKSRTMAIFAQHGKRYVDVVCGRRIAEALKSLNRLKKCKTFCRFAQNFASRGL